MFSLFFVWQMIFGLGPADLIYYVVYFLSPKGKQP